MVAHGCASDALAGRSARGWLCRRLDVSPYISLRSAPFGVEREPLMHQAGSRNAEVVIPECSYD
jgi:hypothetical protein